MRHAGALPGDVVAIQAVEGLGHIAIQTGWQCYLSGNWKCADVHLRRVVEADPDDAYAHYWLGRVNETLSDFSVPLTGRYFSRARLHLAKAVELDPARGEYRNEFRPVGDLGICQRSPGSRWAT